MPPIQLLLTRRLLLAKQLLTETTLPITEVAFASGFSSLRRFNDAFSGRYGMPPTRLRKKATEDAAAIAERQTSTLQLSYRPPYDWRGILAFLAARALAGVEHVTDGVVRPDRAAGRRDGLDPGDAVDEEARADGRVHAQPDAGAAGAAQPRAGAVRSQRAARPDREASPQGRAPGAAVRANPGLRVPGAFNGFEMGLRAILGQQVTVKAATTIACRFVEAFGEPIVTPFAGTESPDTRAGPGRRAPASMTSPDTASSPRAAGASSRWREAQGSGGLCLDGGAHHNPDDSIKRLAELPGIGPWTAHYIAMRALRWPDAFPKEDIAVRNNLGGVTAKEAEVLSQPWRPWRSYAVMHVWGMATPPTTP